MGQSLESAAVAVPGPRASPHAPTANRFRVRSRFGARVLGAVVALAGLLGLTFDLFAAEPYTDLGLVVIGLVPIVPERLRRVRLALAGAVGAGGLALLAHALPGTDAAGPHAVMPPVTALVFVLVGLLVACEESRSRRAHILGVALTIGLMLGCLGFGLGYIYGADDAIRAPTVIALAMGVAALRMAHPERGLLGLVTDASAASVQLVLMVPATVLVPTVLGVVFLEAYRAGLVSLEVGQTIVALATTLLIGAFVVWTARRILRFELRRLTDAAALREAHDELERRVDERTAEATQAMAHYRALLDGVNAAIVTVGVDGRVVQYNRTAERWTGYSADEVVGKVGPLHWHDPDDVRRLVARREAELGKAFPDPMRMFVSGLRSGRPNVFECLYRRKDGTTFPVLLSITRVEAGDQLIGFAGIAVDIEERRAAESALVKAKDTAEAATRARADFVARMSHELRTPLNGVLGFLALTLDTGLEAEQREFVTSAHEAASSLLRLVDDILDFSKIDARRLELETIPMTLSAVLEAALRPLALKAKTRGLAFEIDVADDVPDRLIGDPTRLGQVLVNLVGNAVKFTERGRVRVAVRLAESDAGRVLLRFEVKDSGIGIPAEKLERIFEPFAQADEATTRRYGGTGLGLPISLELVKMMGGRLDVASALGEGTTFSFTMRFATRPPTAVRPLPLVAPRAGLRVLVAEDNPTNLLLATRLLERAGHVVTSVSDGRRAVEAALSGEFDVVLMDVQMPELDGLQATRAIRDGEARTGRRLPIVGLTAQVLSGDDARCFEAGMDGYVAKPFDAHGLVAAIDAAVGRAGGAPTAAAPPPS